MKVILHKHPAYMLEGISPTLIQHKTLNPQLHVKAIGLVKHDESFPFFMSNHNQIKYFHETLDLDTIMPSDFIKIFNESAEMDVIIISLGSYHAERGASPGSNTMSTIELLKLLQQMEYLASSKVYVTVRVADLSNGYVIFDFENYLSGNKESQDLVETVLTGTSTVITPTID